MGRNVGPQYDSIDPRILDHLKLAAEVGIAGHEFLFNHDGMTKPAGSVAEF